MSLHYKDDDLEPFLSEILDEALPPRWRLGSLLYLDARETFLSSEHRHVLDAARERICRALAIESSITGIDQDAGSPSPPRTQGMLFPTQSEP